MIAFFFIFAKMGCSQIKKKPNFIELTSYRRRDVNAYVSRVNEEGNIISYENNDYGKPATQKDLEKSYRDKMHTVLIDISQFEDGFYFYEESSGEGGRTRTGYLFIENGDIVIEFDIWDECIEYLLNLKYEALMSALPELEGSPKQIKWAETIRLKAIQKLIKLGYSIENIKEQLCDREASKQARKWIELRNHF